MYDKENKEIRRDYTAVAAYGWKTWGDNVPTVKLVVGNYSTGGEQNLTEEEVGQVIEMLQNALAEAKAAKDNEHTNYSEDETPF